MIFSIKMYNKLQVKEPKNKTFLIRIFFFIRGRSEDKNTMHNYTDTYNFIKYLTHFTKK